MQKEKLKIGDYFHKGKDPYTLVPWKKTNITITGDNNKPLFVQKDVEFPAFFSELSKKIVASRYFYGDPKTNERENSFKTLVNRVTSTYGKWAVEQKYMEPEEAKKFVNELTYLNLNQMMAFNSPVWFNVGTDKYNSKKTNDKREEYGLIDGEIKLIPPEKLHEAPQTSACFIQSVEDTMEGIMDLAKREALLFRHGSGTGTNLSTLRSSKEKLSGGGKPSGPLAYLMFYSDVAGIVKSGGKTRRAAKMNILNIEHPDIEEFITAKSKEQKKLEVLMDYGGIPYTEASETVSYQNANLSIRISDEFMRAYENDEEWQTKPIHNKELKDKMPKYKARDLMRLIAEGTWSCGDPGVQFDTTINEWHTCPNSDRINSSNPCSEYMFIDNSSCNLASLNLMSFMDSGGKFDIQSFENAIKITAIAQDLNFERSSFPTKEIAENSYKFRPLGMGYANLGAMMMSLGLPYDSDEARNSAAAISALMTGKVYETSAEMAEKLGTFQEYEKNKEPMLKVIKKHRSQLKNIDRKKLPTGLEEILDEAEIVWDNAIKKGEMYGFRNAQATVLAPTGTIGFMMDCATKGIEPEIGLVQYKLLSEGGTLKMVNNTMPLALKNLGYKEQEIEEITKYVIGHGIENVPGLKQQHYETLKNSTQKSEKLKELGYSENEIKEILFYIEGHDTIEGCNTLKQEHLAIFDCANKPPNGVRTISPQGHINMMAAVQPFLSGAISKTVNLPENATVEEIEKTYYDAWKKGLKAVAIYRDRSKRGQPLSFKKKGLEGKVNGEGNPIRRRLPETRNSITHKFNIENHEGYITVGLYDDGKPGEVFITMSKEGSTLGGLMDSLATTMSLALQHGVPLNALTNKLENQNFPPKGLIYSEDLKKNGIHTISSISDYLGKWLKVKFLNDSATENKYHNNNNNNTEITEKKVNNTKKSEENSEIKIEKWCPICSNQLTRMGSCKEVCKTCGFENQDGCGQ